jgi:hypothetical protein
MTPDQVLANMYQMMAFYIAMVGEEANNPPSFKSPIFDAEMGNWQKTQIYESQGNPVPYSIRIGASSKAEARVKREAQILYG